MQRVAIIGLGLIGGSIGLGLRNWSSQNAKSGQPALDIVGFDSDLDQQGYAKKINAVDKTEWELRKAVQGADLVVLCTPVLATREVFTDIAEYLKPGAVVTDTGSTKADVLRWAQERLPTNVDFIGSHPMAGKSMSIEGAEANLFEGATWCVTPSVRASEESIRTVLGMITALGAQPYFIDPEEHDAYVAGISHMPFVISASMMNALSSDNSWRDMKTLTASGFRDMTRLSAGSPAMHRDIALTNRAAIVRWIDAMTAELAGFRDDLLAESDEASENLLEFFNRARDARAEWATQTTREGELLQGTQSELSNEGFGDQMSRMLFGSFLRKRGTPRTGRGTPAANGSEHSDRTR